MRKALTFAGSQLLFLSPLVAFAQEDLGPISTFFEKVFNLIDGTLIPLMFALAILVFFYGIFKYFILGGGDEGSRGEGRQLMLWGIIGFVVMVSLYGIIALVQQSLDINANETVDLPTSPSLR